MPGPDRGRRLLPARRVLARAVAEERRAPRLVERGPGVHPVAERAVHQRRVVREPAGGVPLRPAAGVLQRLRQVPVVERQPRLDAPVEQPVHQPGVEVQPAPVGRAAPGRLHPRPGHREPVRRQPELGHQLDVLAPAVVVVDRDVAGAAAAHPTRRVAEGVPDRRPATVLCGRSLDLVGRGGGAPDEPGRQPAAARGRRGGEQLFGHAFSAPSMMPPMICRPNRTKTSSSGSVASAVPAKIWAKSE